MIVVCNSCTTRLQLDDAKIPERAFTVRCPKCQTTINVTPASSSDSSTNGHGPSSAIESVNVRTPQPAPAYNPGQSAKESNGNGTALASVEPGDLASMLVKLLQTGVQGQAQSNGRFNWERRRVLVCVSPPYREAIARTLSDEKYHVFLADDIGQAIDRMREERMEVVILEADFDEAQQGFALVTNEINSLRPNVRRRLIFVQMSGSANTGDTYGAFVNNVNVIFNPFDIPELPQLLERTMRDLNELYNNFNLATSLSGF